jgi:hypothetical protein
MNCTEQTSGNCQRDSDCSGGLVCSQEMIAGVYHRCVQPGDGGTDARGDSDVAPSCGGSADCPDPAKPVCDVATRTCVGCLMDNDCPLGMPACNAATHTCGSCQNDLQCSAKSATLTHCGGGSCIECGTDTDCAVATKPFCSTAGACVGCGAAPMGAGACAVRSAASPVCAASGACVECVVNSDCATSAKPACSTANTCGPCTADSDCAGRPGPGVCMAHQDGRCATDAETIYLQNVGTCSESGGSSGGTSAIPFCSMQPVLGVVGDTRDLVVVRGSVNGATSAFSGGAKQISIIGQTSATIAAGVNPPVHVAGGDFYLRNLKLGLSSAIGCQADVGSTLRLDHVNVSGNSGGGILLDGAAFVISNATVSGNGPGTFGAFTWGGVLINNPPGAGPTQLQLVTVQTNDGGGVSCSATVQGIDVSAAGNLDTPVQISTACGFSSCGAASATCGAQP